MHASLIDFRFISKFQENFRDVKSFMKDFLEFCNRAEPRFTDAVVQQSSDVAELCI